ncbi:MAG: glycerophosphodiester phosphodiesterase, partial [Armatimonadota bacterium]|nr:glycerophosphodiester phosphodiesterase [Armatimonadota bacterium]
PAVTVSSFDHPLLLEVRAHLPKVPRAVLYVARPVDPLRLARDAGADLLHPHWSLLSSDVVEAAHAAGLGVETWVVDDPEEMARVVAMGVDGVMTNHPQRLRTVLAGLRFPLPPPART